MFCLPGTLKWLEGAVLSNSVIKRALAEHIFILYNRHYGEFMGIYTNICLLLCFNVVINHFIFDKLHLFIKQMNILLG